MSKNILKIIKKLNLKTKQKRIENLWGWSNTRYSRPGVVGQNGDGQSHPHGLWGWLNHPQGL
jgi:hypothetical protein